MPPLRLRLRGAILIDGTPQEVLLAIDGYHAFIEMPFVTEAWGVSSDLVRVIPPELFCPCLTVLYVSLRVAQNGR